MCRANLLRETHEVHKQGSTRVVYGAGCAVRRLLLGNAFVRLNVEHLPTSYTDETLKLKIVELVPAAEVTLLLQPAPAVVSLPCIWLVWQVLHGCGVYCISVLTVICFCHVAALLSDSYAVWLLAISSLQALPSIALQRLLAPLLRIIPFTL